MNTQIDISENHILEKYPEVLNILLKDQTSEDNIFWATNNYEHLGKSYTFKSQILTDSITGENDNVIMPRVQKDKILKQSRSRDMAEVFTPSWLCNIQNNLIDNAWFKKKDVFNIEIKKPDGVNSWLPNSNRIVFPKGKGWKKYINEKRLEVSCGEGPYITSRYDTTSGDFISIERRIGILDRKLRVIHENTNTSSDWLKAAQIAYKSTYAYEWQGDNLLLAREAMLYTFIENYKFKFNKEPMLKSIKHIANIISWNVWQMDGLKGVIPDSCADREVKENTLFDQTTKIETCVGCAEGSIKKHNGKYCFIKDWNEKGSNNGKKGGKIKFIDLL